MDKKFKNLPAKYRALLEDIGKYIPDEEKTLIIQQKLPFKRVQEIFVHINRELLPKHDCDPYDINRLLRSYQKENDILKLIEIFVRFRNKEIAKLAGKSPLWKDNIKNLIEYCKQMFKSKCSYDLVEKAFISLLKRYMVNWSGFWSIITVSEKGEIKDITVFDTQDYDIILIYIGKKLKWDFRNPDEKKRIKQCIKDKVYKVA